MFARKFLLWWPWKYRFVCISCQIITAAVSKSLIIEIELMRVTCNATVKADWHASRRRIDCSSLKEILKADEIAAVFDASSITLAVWISGCARRTFRKIISHLCNWSFILQHTLQGMLMLKHYVSKQSV